MQYETEPHGYFLVNFVTSFVEGEMSRHEFDMDYSGYVIEHFPGFRKEHPRLASRFADTIDFAYDLGEHKSDDDLRASMADALDDFFGNRQDCDIF